MSTPYSTLFDSFLAKIEDVRYQNMTQLEAEDDMIKLLNSAIVSFEYPKVDVYDKDDVLKQFNQVLGVKEVEILANLMKLEWINRQMNSIYLLKQSLTNSDFKMTSQAHHLQSLIKLKNETENFINDLKTKYSYSKDHKANFYGLAGE